MVELWPQQEKAKDMLIRSIKGGDKRTICAAPTGFGKTVLSANIMKGVQEKNKRGIFICDRIKLVNQTINKFREVGIDFGVRQASHDLHDPTKPIQIISVQTMEASLKHGRPFPMYDMAIIDECHTQYDSIKRMLELNNNVPTLGMSATPGSKGLGDYWDAIINPCTTRELEQWGALTPVEYVVAPKSSSEESKKKNKNAQNGERYVAGDIVKSWLEHANGLQTIAFSPTKKHSQNLVLSLRESGISAEHIDCDMGEDEREDLYSAHNDGEFMVLSCSRLLNTGYDSPSTKCVIDCYPVKSIITWVQRVGRVKRNFDGIDKAVYLDLAGNYWEHGPAEDIEFTSLHKSTDNFNESELVTKSEVDEKQAIILICPQCNSEVKGTRCSCGYIFKTKDQIIDSKEKMKAVGGNAAYKKDPITLKQQFYGEMLGQAYRKGYKTSWADRQFFNKYKVWPKPSEKSPRLPVTQLGKGWIKHIAIKERYAR